MFNLHNYDDIMMGEGAQPDIFTQSSSAAAILTMMTLMVVMVHQWLLAQIIKVDIRGELITKLLTAEYLFICQLTAHSLVH